MGEGVATWCLFVVGRCCCRISGSRWRAEFFSWGMNATAPFRGGGISNSSESSTRAEGIALVELLCIGAVGPVHLHGHVHLIAEHHADAIGCDAYHHRWRTD